MAVSIKVTQETGNVPPEKFWLGFLVSHKENLLVGAVSRVAAVEIASLGLNPSESGRTNGGFIYPLDLRNVNRANRQIVGKYYVQIDDLDLAFNNFRFIEAVEFFVGVKGSGTLEQLSGSTAVSFISDGVDNSFAVDADQRLRPGILKSFAKKTGPRLAFDVGGGWGAAKDYQGDIAAYCVAREQQLNLRPEPTPPPIDLGWRRSPPTTPIAPQPKRPEAEVPPIDPTTALNPLPRPPSPKPTTLPLPPSVIRPPETPKVFRNVAIGIVAVVVALAFLGLPKKTVPAGDESTKAQLPQKDKPVVIAKEPAPVPPMRPVPVPEGNLATEQSASPQTSAPALPPPPPPPGYPSDLPPVPGGKSLVTRERLYTFGFPEHLAKTTQVIKAMRDRDEASFAEARDWLKANRQSVDFDQATVVERRKFNEATEQKIVTARAAKDTAALRESAIALDAFLQQNFGAATAHLNLAIVRVLLEEHQAALPSAFHTIVFNPEGANGWVLLGAALAGNNDIAGGAGAFCAALNIAKFSPKTIGLFTRIETGEEYMSGGAREAMQRTHVMCPGSGW